MKDGNVQPHLFLPGDEEDEEENGTASVGISELDMEDAVIGNRDEEDEEDEEEQQDLEDHDEYYDEDDDDDHTLHPDTLIFPPSAMQHDGASSFIVSSSSARPSMPLRSQSTSALNGTNHTNITNSTNNNNNPFAPPFYNRPPTPLPPSPSLTSLLRPAFSTTSRQTTPDSSDVETTANENEDVVAKSARTATTVSRVSPKIPTYEYYGFVLYLGSGLAFLIYLLWSYLPSPFLHQFGIYYYPDRWWSLAIPSYLVMLVIYIYVALASYNTQHLTLPMNSIECIVDEAASIAAIPPHTSSASSTPNFGGVGRGADGAMGHHNSGRRRERRREGDGEEKIKDWKSLWNEGTDAVLDVPIGGVCEILYRN